MLCWCNAGPIHGCGWTNIFDVGPALVQHVLTVMYCVCWAHNHLRLKQRQQPVLALYGASVTEVVSNIRTTSRRDITNLWSLYPASLMSLSRLFVSHMREVNVLRVWNYKTSYAKHRTAGFSFINRIILPSLKVVIAWTFSPSNKLKIETNNFSNTSVRV